MKRRTLAILLAACLMGESLGATVYAEDSYDDSYDYTSDDMDEYEEDADEFEEEYDYDSYDMEYYEYEEEVFSGEVLEAEEAFSEEELTDEEGFVGDGNSENIEGIDAEDYENVEAGFEVHVNPLFAGIIEESDLLLPEEAEEFEEEYGTLPLDEEVEIILDEEEYFELTADTLNADAPSATSEAAVTLRNALKNRQSSIAVSVKTTSISGLATSLWNEAIEYTGDPEEGDYLKWNYAGWTASYRMVAGTARITFKVTYYTTAAQEAELSSRVNDVLAELNLEEKSYTGGLKAIYDYICKKVYYDYDHVDNEDYTMQYTAYAAMMNETAVCQGYAALFYRMAVQAGYHVRIIGGYSNAGAHAWNMLGIDGLYYYVDTTRDASAAKRGTNYNYFLIGSNTSYYLRDSEFSTAEYVSRYPMSGSDYHEFDSAVEATCETPGTMGGGKCILCGKKIGTVAEVPALGHDWEEVVIPATTTEDGCIQRSCSRCGKAEEMTPIYHPVEYTLSETERVFDGKTHPLSVEVKDNAGNIIPSTDYSIRYYDMNGINYGVPYGAFKYRVAITFSGNYSGTHDEYFVINKATQTVTAKDLTIVNEVDNGYVTSFSSTGNSPIILRSQNAGVVMTDGMKLVTMGPGTAYVDVKALESANYQEAVARIKVTVLPRPVKIASICSKLNNSITLSWNISKGVSGYEIQYSTSTSFKNAKSVKVMKEKTVSTVINNVPEGYYYVRVRAYHTSGTTTLNSNWSSSSTIRVASK